MCTAWCRVSEQTISEGCCSRLTFLPGCSAPAHMQRHAETSTKTGEWKHILEWMALLIYVTPIFLLLLDDVLINNLKCLSSSCYHCCFLPKVIQHIWLQLVVLLLFFFWLELEIDLEMRSILQVVVPGNRTWGEPEKREPFQKNQTSTNVYEHKR